MLCLYICNYKLASEKDFKLLSSMYNSAEYPQGQDVLNNILKMTQADKSGKIYSKEVIADKFGRITPYVTHDEIKEY